MYRFSNGSFYPSILQGAYESAGSWPENGVDVTDEVFKEFSVSPSGKTVGTDTEGRPCWVDVPPPSHDELIAAAESKRVQLLNYADEVVKDWRVELALGEISDEDKAKLSAWISYKKAVKSVDTSTAPDITWPEKPE
ncbi:phage tail protein [Lonsdalea britannica]|uniref:tail fiber assembly protein n=1 Tax=Lonsdalea britannica TaxID=1082704 RepID=UPI000A1EC8FA|nr:tail fiber assembly protein [Lonsdalea britannica]OSN07205.1 phage tail protein [Lonsdalea britannica]